MPKKKGDSQPRFIGMRPAQKGLGANIRRLRRSRNFSQLQLAHAIGFKGSEAGSYISRIERGTNKPTLATLFRIADALGVSLETLTKR